MRKNLLRKYLVPLFLLSIFVYILYNNSETFQNYRELNSTNGADGNQGEVRITNEGLGYGYLRLQYATKDPVTKEYKCIVPNPNPRGFKSYLYNPIKDFVSPSGKKICMTFRTASSIRNFGTNDYKDYINGKNGEVGLLNGDYPLAFRLQYTTLGKCIEPSRNLIEPTINPNGFKSYLYNPTRDLVSPSGKKICITIRETL